MPICLPRKRGRCHHDLSCIPILFVGSPRDEYQSSCTESHEPLTWSRKPRLEVGSVLLGSEGESVSFASSGSMEMEMVKWSER